MRLTTSHPPAQENRDAIPSSTPPVAAHQPERRGSLATTPQVSAAAVSVIVTASMLTATHTAYGASANTGTSRRALAAPHSERTDTATSGTVRQPTNVISTPRVVGRLTPTCRSVHSSSTGAGGCWRVSTE